MLKRYIVVVDGKTIPAEYGFSADSTLKQVEKALRESATSVVILEREVPSQENLTVAKQILGGEG